MYYPLLRKDLFKVTSFITLRSHPVEPWRFRKSVRRCWTLRNLSGFASGCERLAWLPKKQENNKYLTTSVTNHKFVDFW